VRDVVKRIRKRVSKKESESTDAADEVLNPEDAPTGLRAELASYGEDNFTRQIAGSLGWMLDNRGILITGTALAAVAVIAVTVMNSQERSAKAEAASSFHLAANGYSEIVLPTSANPGEDAKKDDSAERTKKLEKALRDFSQTRATYGSNPIVTLAELGEAGTSADLGKHDEAIKLYDAALNRQGIDSMTKLIALQGKASALENKGDSTGALAAWKTVGDLDTQAFGVLAGLQQGRILEATGKGDEAHTLYKAIEKDHAKALEEMSNREYRAELDKRLSRLGDGE